MRQQLFVSGWTFRKKGGEARQVTLPHDATIREKRKAFAPSGSGGAFFPGGYYIYEKTFTAPAGWRDGCVMLRFEGVYPMAQVFINDVPAGGTTYGYSEFYIPFEGLRYGEENTIRVEVDNEGVPNSRWYAGAGIYRPVYLLEGGKEHILPDGIQVTTLSADPAVISVKTAHTSADSEIFIEIFEKGPQGIGRKVAEAKGDCAEITIDGAKLWDAEHPDLYICRATLICGGRASDQAETVFGIRTLSWSPEGFFVNGRSVLFKGGCVHHDNGILGACTYPEAERRRVAKLKAGGFNAIRSAHNPMCRYALEACDEIGMYVMDETWDMWDKHKTPYDYAGRFADNFKDDLAAMVRKDYDHPCVVMYSIGNEVTEPAKPEGVGLAEKIVGALKALDATRPVTAGINLTLLLLASMGNDLPGAAEQDGDKETADAPALEYAHMDSTAYNKMVTERGNSMTMAAALPAADAAASPVLGLLDIQGYNYASSRYETEGVTHPERILVGSETYPYDLVKNWAMVERLPYLTGDFMWTAWDYIGEAGIGAWSYDPEDAGFAKGYPWLLADSGAYDILGDDNAEAGRAAVVWGARTEPYIGVRPVNHHGAEPCHSMWRDTNALPRWSYKGCEGEPAVVEVYAAGAAAELFVNGRSAGIRPLRDQRAVFETIYEPGVLRAVVFDESGAITGESRLESADEDTQITISAEGPARIGGLLYVNVDITGADKIIECNADEQVTLSVRGAQVLGFGSADPKTEESFVGCVHRTYYGRSQAVLLIEEDTIEVAASARGLKRAVLRLTAAR